jgi:hypothetical protein
MATFTIRQMNSPTDITQFTDTMYPVQSFKSNHPPYSNHLFYMKDGHWHLVPAHHQNNLDKPYIIPFQTSFVFHTPLTYPAPTPMIFSQFSSSRGSSTSTPDTTSVASTPMSTSTKSTLMTVPKTSVSPCTQSRAEILRDFHINKNHSVAEIECLVFKK